MAEYNIARVKARSFRIELNRLLLNYLSITKSYINYIETDTARTYGKNSKQTKSLKKTLSFCFDNSFSYRFLYKLRNYAQHIDLPIRDISLKLKRIEKDKLIHFLKINFDKDTLLNNYKEWGHIVKKDLENKENDLKVINLLYRHIEPINYIHRKITNIRKNEFEKAIIFLTNLSNDYRKKYKTLCVFRSSPIYENGKLTREKLKIQPLDLNLLDLITDQINNDA